jgi:hypothetical protein
VTDRGGDLAVQFIDPRLMVPVDLAEQPLDDRAIAVVAVGDRLGVLALHVGEQAGELGAGVGPTLRTGQRGGERLGAVLQATHHAAEEWGRHLTAGAQLLRTTLKARLHRKAPSIGGLSPGRH